MTRVSNSRGTRRKDSGFAMLLVFLMAAIIAITMYMELPRVAFDSQRQKEQLLMERGQQYKVAIRRFMAQNKRWPKDLDELESFNTRHYLRHRYKDPMTGKDEWRIIHIQNGVLTDSVNSKQKGDQAKNNAPNGFIQEMAGLGTTGTQGASKVNIAMRQRPSDSLPNMPGMGTGGGVTDPNNPGVIGQPTTGNLTLAPGGQPIPGQSIPGQSIPGQVQPVMGAMPPGVPSVPTPANSQQQGGFIANQPGLGSIGATPTPAPTGQPVYPGQQPFPGAPGMPVNSQTGGVSPYPVQAGANGVPPGYPQPGTNVNQNAATQLINGILTSPRPGGMAGIQPGAQPGFGQQQPGFGQQQTGFGQQQTGFGQQTTGFGAPTPAGGGGIGTPVGTPIGGPGGIGGGQTIGGGVAGVASNADGESIMVYDDHTNYSEWEFVFDPTKWHAPPNPNGGTIGNQIGQSIGTPIQPGGPGGANPGNPGFGAGPGIGGAGGFGANNPQQQQGGTSPQGGAAGAGAFGAGGLVNIRPGRK